MELACGRRLEGAYQDDRKQSAREERISILASDFPRLSSARHRLAFDGLPRGTQSPSRVPGGAASSLGSLRKSISHVDSTQPGGVAQIMGHNDNLITFDCLFVAASLLGAILSGRQEGLKKEGRCLCFVVRLFGLFAGQPDSRSA